MIANIKCLQSLLEHDVSTKISYITAEQSYIWTQNKTNFQLRNSHCIQITLNTFFTPDPDTYDYYLLAACQIKDTQLILKMNPDL